jgi:hypothetical protein
MVRREIMAEQIKYEKPKLVGLSATEWEIGTGRCETGSAPDVNDPSVDCQSGAAATRACNTGNNLP